MANKYSRRNGNGSTSSKPIEEKKTNSAQTLNNTVEEKETSSAQTLNNTVEEKETSSAQTLNNTVEEEKTGDTHKTNDSKYSRRNGNGSTSSKPIEEKKTNDTHKTNDTKYSISNDDDGSTSSKPIEEEKTGDTHKTNDSKYSRRNGNGSNEKEKPNPTPTYSWHDDDDKDRDRKKEENKSTLRRATPEPIETPEPIDKMNTSQKEVKDVKVTNTKEVIGDVKEDKISVVVNVKFGHNMKDIYKKTGNPEIDNENATNRAKINALKRLAEEYYAKTGEKLDLKLIGTADLSGNPKYNLKLSEKRNENIRSGLGDAFNVESVATGDAHSTHKYSSGDRLGINQLELTPEWVKRYGELAKEEYTKEKVSGKDPKDSMLITKSAIDNNTTLKNQITGNKETIEDKTTKLTKNADINDEFKGTTAASYVSTNENIKNETINGLAKLIDGENYKYRLIDNNNIIKQLDNAGIKYDPIVDDKNRLVGTKIDVNSVNTPKQYEVLNSISKDLKLNVKQGKGLGIVESNVDGKTMLSGVIIDPNINKESLTKLAGANTFKLDENIVKTPVNINLVGKSNNFKLNLAKLQESANLSYEEFNKIVAQKTATPIVKNVEVVSKSNMKTVEPKTYLKQDPRINPIEDTIKYYSNLDDRSSTIIGTQKNNEVVKVDEIIKVNQNNKKIAYNDGRTMDARGMFKRNKKDNVVYIYGRSMDARGMKDNNDIKVNQNNKKVERYSDTRGMIKRKKDNVANRYTKEKSIVKSTTKVNSGMASEIFGLIK